MITWMDFVFDEVLGPVLASKDGESLIRVIDQEGRSLVLNQEASKELDAALSARARMAESIAIQQQSGKTRLEKSAEIAGSRDSSKALSKTARGSNG